MWAAFLPTMLWPISSTTAPTSSTPTTKRSKRSNRDTGRLRAAGSAPMIKRRPSDHRKVLQLTRLFDCLARPCLLRSISAGSSFLMSGKKNPARRRAGRSERIRDTISAQAPAALRFSRLDHSRQRGRVADLLCAASFGHDRGSKKAGWLVSQSAIAQPPRQVKSG